ncbi:MAG: hypothetical protein NT030_03735, partial [Candidatus Saganbacteria bacterium]|nr:hypothetical protein [Candidatus Saganbacteria bacterium]
GPKPFSGKQFVFTGGLEGYTRLEAEDIVRRLGGIPSSSVSKQTDFVVVGSEAGSKFDKAKPLGVNCINEKEFTKMIGKYL